LVTRVGGIARAAIRGSLMKPGQVGWRPTVVMLVHLEVAWGSGTDVVSMGGEGWRLGQSSSEI
jgi:hypothetical protein